MVVMLNSWWQKKRKPLDAVIITLLIVLFALFGVSILGYIFHWDWTGLNGFNSTSIATDVTSTPQKITRTIAYQPGKTLWDWLQLLIIPAVLAVGGYLFNYTTSKNEHDIALDNQREAVLQSYIDKVSELLLHEKLRESQPENEVRKIARVRTLTVLPRLDRGRKESVLQFLYESGLIEKGKSIIDLSGADLRDIFLVQADLSKADLSGADLSEATLSYANLSDANLSGADLHRADLHYADLHEANLRGADLHRADLSGADLREANLRGVDPLEPYVSRANLRGANLRGADLSEANVTAVQLDSAKSLQGATMPDGSTHPW